LRQLKILEQILADVNFPKDLNLLSVDELQLLCNDVRETIIEVLSKTPGHFSSSLGTVELAVGIHHVFNTPNDKLIWDVGHQAYAHKILTGRQAKFNSIRQKGGLSGFPKMSESEFDSFGTGHSSTSLSAILGMATAAKLDNKLSQHIAVIGDGALTGGMAFEALNNAASSGANVLIIINDNNMSIDDNVGALQEHLNTLSIKETSLFENLNIPYYGVSNGNNINEVVAALEEQKEIFGIRVLHCKTTKGYGYFPAEIGNATTWHAPGKFDVESGEREGSSSVYPKKYQSILGETLIDLARNNKDVVAVTPAMLSGSSLKEMKALYPKRVFDVGIAEQHAVTFSAGLAANGKTPYCVIYSSFLQRGYDQLIHDVALQNLPVIFCIDRAGLVGSDGATHHGAFDIAFLRCIPNLTLLSPINEQELANMLYTAQSWKSGPIAIRYPRGKGVMLKTIEKPSKIDFGTGKLITKGKGVTILSVGAIGNEVITALGILESENINVSHYDMQSIKPLDKELLTNIFNEYSSIITIEDGVVSGGFGSAILEFRNQHSLTSSIKILGLPDSFIEHGTQKELYHELGLDSLGIIKTIKAELF
jgi:1-deoxy-D-xylulose-5-phosphate synthase